MRPFIIGLAALILVGCVPGHRYQSRWPENDGMRQERFQADLKACGGGTGASFVGPWPLAVAFLAVAAVLTETERGCMEKRGWHSVGRVWAPEPTRDLPQPPLVSEPDGGLHERAGDLR